MKKNLVFLVFYLFYGCTPIKSTAKDEKHQLELTLHEVQTNIDEIQHNISCFQTEIQILDSKINNQEKLTQKIKHDYFETSQNKIHLLTTKFELLEKKIKTFESNEFTLKKDLSSLTSHANETTTVLTQYNDKIKEIENQIFSQNRRLGEISKLKSTLDSIAKSIKQISNVEIPFTTYKVQAGDSLEKIAKKKGLSIDEIKKINNLQNDLIVVGQKLKVPKIK